MRTWIDVPADSFFPLENLPYGVFHQWGTHCCVRIGDFVVDLWALAHAGVLPLPWYLFEGDLTRFASEGPEAWRVTRERLTELLSADHPRLRDDVELRTNAVLPLEGVRLQMPVTVGDYTDFYSSREHATNVGAMFRPDAPLMPNWLHLPVAYHGRASSLVLSERDVIRPHGQTGAGAFGPTRSLDYELEVAAVIGPGNKMGEPIRIEDAEDHIFGLVLLNDWSARDIQSWEYQPLGPFLGKNFATSISPWVVPLAALEPWRCPGPPQEPVLTYLTQTGSTTFDINLEATINGTPVTRTNFRYLYWSLRQQIAHHTVNGCPLRPGDLLASGTVSGPTPESRGCLLELTRRGSEPLTLADGSLRRFLEDGDRVTLTGWAQGDGYRVGFGEVTGRIRPAR
ncbi:MAG: fumarylacetoacetase [Planctomycetia bacterium]|nr:fumarylacetoacetase [Planctomycetia bacterium]